MSARTVGSDDGGTADFRARARARLLLLGSLVLAPLSAYVVWRSLRRERAGAPSSVRDSARRWERNTAASRSTSAISDRLWAEVTGEVLPARGFESRVRLGASIVKLIEAGVIDPQKFGALYRSRSGLSVELERILAAPSDQPIVLTPGNAGDYVNLLWPVGLANHMSANEKSPLNGKSISNFASTAGWTLGKEGNGSAYFNRFRIVALTPDEEARVTRIARHTYRPCCNNSTFFQDCNHGSALLGLLELGASQGLTDDELYREALTFNSFWFPRNYVETAIYFRVARGIDWTHVDPREVMGFDYSAAGPWSRNVHAKLAGLPSVLRQQMGAACAT